MAVDNIYNETPVTKANTNIWYSAKNIEDARGQISPSPVPRMQEQYASKASLPTVSFVPQAISHGQARRVVTSSIARKSVVTSEGMVSRALGGKSVSSSSYSPFDDE